MSNQLGEFFDKETDRIWELVGGLSQEDLHAPIRDDDWSAFMLLAHMAASSRGLLTLARRQHAALKAGQSLPDMPEGFDVHRNNEQAVAEWDGKSLDDVRAAWDETGRRLKEFAAGLPEEDLALPARFATGDPMTLGQLLNVITFHLRQHRQELETGLARLHP